MNLLDDFDHRWLFVVCFIICANSIANLFRAYMIVDPMSSKDDEWKSKFSWLNGEVMIRVWNNGTDVLLTIFSASVLFARGI
jgi:hypothetical protein